MHTLYYCSTSLPPSCSAHMQPDARLNRSPSLLQELDQPEKDELRLAAQAGRRVSRSSDLSPCYLSEFMSSTELNKHLGKPQPSLCWDPFKIDLHERESYSSLLILSRYHEDTALHNDGEAISPFQFSPPETTAINQKRRRHVNASLPRLHVNAYFPRLKLEHYSKGVP